MAIFDCAQLRQDSCFKLLTTALEGFAAAFGSVQAVLVTSVHQAGLQDVDELQSETVRAAAFR